MPSVNAEELYQRQQTDHAKTKALHTAIDMKGPLPGALWQDPFMHHVAFASPRANNRCHDQTYMLPQQHKMDQLKQDLSKKESEMLALQTKLETLANQNSDCKQHIEVLKESLSAKEQRASVLQSEGVMEILCPLSSGLPIIHQLLHLA